MKFRIGILADLHARPLYHSLHSSASAELLLDMPASHIDKLLSKEMDAAFISPMDYALNSSDLIVLPDIGVSSTGFSNVARLYFRNSAASISTMAVNSVTTLDVVSARVVLSEKYDVSPAIVPVQGTIDDLLSKADCALVGGEPLLSVSTDKPFIDIADEWSDISEFPFVHTVCVMRNEGFVKELSDLLTDAQHRGRLSIETISNELSKTTTLPNETIYQFLSHLSYGLDDDGRQSLDEFFRMAYYHGMLNDIPEIRYAR